MLEVRNRGLYPVGENDDCWIAKWTLLEEDIRSGTHMFFKHTALPL